VAEGGTADLAGYGKVDAAASGQVELRAVTKRYGLDTVVAAVTTTIAPGEFFSLLGPSGSGKTTTLMMVAGFVTPDAGTILLDDREIVNMPPQRRGFGMVFQNYAIFPHLNVFENVAFPLRARRLPQRQVRQRVTAALELVRLQDYASRFSRQLSGGQQQRVALARAVVFHPRVVLMDEPLGALDRNLRYQMQVEIKEIQQRLGMTVVYVTHDQEEAMNLSDRVAIMNRGRIEQVGPPAEVYERPRTAFVARFLGEANLIAGTVTACDDGIARLRTPHGAELRAKVADGPAAGTAALLFTRPEKLTIDVANAPATGDGANELTGQVRRAAFLGNIIRYTVDIGADAPLTVDVQNAAVRPTLQAGAAVAVQWSPSDSLILAADP
jgi:spermidine/putrescine ABC transporter ATP-binding subunit